MSSDTISDNGWDQSADAWLRVMGEDGDWGRHAVLAARRYYDREEEISGWEAHDRDCGYPVHRLDLLRPPMLPPPANKLVSAWRFLTIDIPLRARVLFTTLRLIRQHRIGCSQNHTCFLRI